MIDQRKEKPRFYMLMPQILSKASNPLTVSEITEEAIIESFTYNIKVLGEPVLGKLLSFHIDDIKITSDIVTIYITCTDVWGDSGEYRFTYNGLFNSEKYLIH